MGHNENEGVGSIVGGNYAYDDEQMMPKFRQDAYAMKWVWEFHKGDGVRVPRVAYCKQELVSNN